MTLEVEATYEDGLIKPDNPLPLRQHERVLVTIKPRVDLVKETYGLISWQGQFEALEFLARSPENSVWEQG
jgi:predicted DNA-binding antitoxin AbrB/MazE fold protein